MKKTKMGSKQTTNNDAAKIGTVNLQLGKTIVVKKSKIVSLVIIILVLCLGAGIGGGFLGQYLKDSSVMSSINSATEDGNQLVTPEEADISKVADEVSPSVVSILTSSVTNTPFYGPAQSNSAGTGVVLSKDGYILTNHHVIDGANQATVVTSDGKTYKDVKVLGSDPLNDIAFLKINNVSDLKPATLGDSTTVRVGQSVVAIGNALGQYKNSVTSGIISGTGRSIRAGSEGANSKSEFLSDLIQTDAAINSGNSGGPLVNMAGQVVGINTAMASDAQGIGFVIPISATKGMISNLLETGKVAKAYLGVRYIDITADVARSYKLPVSQGGYVYSDSSDDNPVIKGSPADKAGIKSGDIIVKVGDKQVGIKGSVASLIGEYRPGDKVSLQINRGGQVKNVDVTLEAYNPQK